MFDIQKLIQFRREMHQFPETGFKEFKTQQKIIQILKEFNIKDDQINKAAGTGLIVNLQGTGPSIGLDKIICFRADIDALKMDELNNDLEYRSQTQAAHMCGHDGHTTCLIGIAALFMDNQDQFGSNKTLRLLFQPNEEGDENNEVGAPVILKEGWLDDVDEIYGFHNLPLDDLPGHLYVKPGPVMANSIIINLKVIGKGGHGSAPELANDPVWPTAEIYKQTQQLIQKYKSQAQVFSFSLPNLHIGQAKNVIADFSFAQGTFRCYSKELAQQFLSEFEDICEKVCLEHNCTKDLKFAHIFDVVENSEKETLNIIKLAKEFFGEQNVSEKGLPMKASEDFSFYLQKVPGTFFFLSSRKSLDRLQFLHMPDYDFPDELIDLGSRFWLKIAQDRLQ